MTLTEALAFGQNILKQSPTPRLDARLLLQFVLGVGHSTLIAYGERPLTPDQQSTYTIFLERAARGEPLPYITGSAPFADFTLQVTPAVLIPRPETEELVERVVAWAASRTKSKLRIADAGTGSGCIPIALARRLPKAQICAGDISPEALDVARSNAARLTPGRIRFFEGHLLEPLPGPFDCITANLPYISEDEWTRLDVGVKYYEPSLALHGGVDGLELIRQLLKQAQTKCAPGARLYLEIGWRQGNAVRQLAAAAFPAAEIIIHPDLAGHDRIVELRTVNG